MGRSDISFFKSEAFIQDPLGLDGAILNFIQDPLGLGESKVILNFFRDSSGHSQDPLGLEFLASFEYASRILSRSSYSLT
jgi:hypothetical protein